MGPGPHNLLKKGDGKDKGKKEIRKKEKKERSKERETKKESKKVVNDVKVCLNRDTADRRLVAPRILLWKSKRRSVKEDIRCTRGRCNRRESSERIFE